MNDIARSTFFFPGAGSFGGEFQSLRDALKPAARLAKYPGRFGKGFGTPAESFDAVIQACAQQISGESAPVLFGHSFGAYVAYATALRLQAEGIKLSALIVVGANAPARLDVPDQAANSPAGAAEYINGVDSRALADAPSDEWREVVAETVMQDLRLLKQFDADPSEIIRCPMFAARGDADPVTSDGDIGAWEHACDAAFSLRVFPGGHSDFLRTPACAAWLTEALETLT